MLNINRLKNAGKIFSTGFLPFILVYYTLGLSPAVLAGIGGIHTYFATSKGFYKKRALLRTGKIIIGVNIAVISALLTKGELLPLLIITPLFVGVVTFFSFEEYLGGFMAHRPIVLIYLLSLSNKGWEGSINNMVGVSLGILSSSLITQIFWPANPDMKMKEHINLYLDRILKEIIAYKRGKDLNSANQETRRSYQKFLGEFYKTSHGSLLSSSYGEELFNFALVLHNYIEGIRRDFNRNKIIEEDLLRAETFFMNLGDLNKEKDRCRGEMSTLEGIILKKKRTLLTFKGARKKSYYPSNKNFFLWLRRVLNIHSVRFRYAIKMSIVLTLGVFLAREYILEKSTWLPTTMLVLTLPYSKDTRRKTVNRIGGTILGILLASLMVPFIKSNTLKAFLAMFSFFPAFLFIGLNYMVLVTFTTLSTILMTISYLPAETVYLQRGFYTVLAGVIVVAAEYFFSDKKHVGIKVRLIAMFQNDLLILRRISELYQKSKKDHIDNLLLRGYLYRELLLRRIKEINNEEYRRVIKDSLIFMDKLMFLYSEFRNHNFSEAHMKDLRIIQEFLEAYIFFLETGEKERLSAIHDKVLTDTDGARESTIEISELVNHFIEETENH